MHTGGLCGWRPQNSQWLCESFAGAAIPVISALQIVLIGSGTDGRIFGQAFFIFGAEVDANLVDDGGGNAILQRQNVADGTLVGFSPEMMIGRDLHEFRGNTHAVAGSQDGSFHEGVHVQTRWRSRERLASAFIGHRGGAGNNPQGTNLGQIGRELISHAIGKIILLAVAR